MALFQPYSLPTVNLQVDVRVNIHSMPRFTPTIAEAIAAKIELKRQFRRANPPKPPKPRKPKSAKAKAKWDGAAGAPIIAMPALLRPPLLPPKPRCTDNPKHGSTVRSFERALEYRHLQLNGPGFFRWMPFDVDRPGAYYAADDANLPPPNVIMVNRANGHAHMNWLLTTPVAKHQFAQLKPLKFFAAVQRGITRRMDADRHFAGDLIKNPAHPDWLVEWRRPEPYTLAELDDALFPHDKRYEPRPKLQFGASRNCSLFDELRQIAYREIRRLKAAGHDYGDYLERLVDIGSRLDEQFPVPLGGGEVIRIARSIAKWTWSRFSDEEFAELQARRGKAGSVKRWAGHEADSTTRPWEFLGVSRATYYRRKATS
jgi:hypothetical protein